MTTKREIHWTLVLPQSGDVAVWVCVQALEENWRLNRDGYIGPGGSSGAIEGRYENFSAWMKTAKDVEMPEVCLVDGQVCINNGRHRFAWFRDHGMTAMQIQVPPEQRKLFQKHFGTDLRVSQYLTNCAQKSYAI